MVFETPVGKRSLLMKTNLTTGVPIWLLTGWDGIPRKKIYSPSCPRVPGGGAGGPFVVALNFSAGSQLE